MSRNGKAQNSRGRVGLFGQKLFADECGSVLMETVVALPLYLILLGGIFWVGDLTLTRQKAVIADRYICWNRANAHISSTFSLNEVTQDLRSGLFGSYSDDRINIERSALRFSPVSNSWSSASLGVVVATLQMPLWTKGMLATQHVHGPLTSLPEEQQLAGRVSQGQGNLIPMWHVIFSRNEYPDSYKPTEARELADPVIWGWIHEEWMNFVHDMDDNS